MLGTSGTIVDKIRERPTVIFNEERDHERPRKAS